VGGVGGGEAGEPGLLLSRLGLVEVAALVRTNARAG
jgi:hypothetical protein